MSPPEPVREPGAQLSHCSTFRLGGPCRELVTCTRADQVLEVVSQTGTDFVFLGGGSNVLISDEGVDCDVVRFVTDEVAVDVVDDTLVVDGACSLDGLAAFCVEEGFEGLEFCSGIPGTVAGAVVGNAGAWGREICHVLAWIECLTPTGELVRKQPGDLGFSYRHSNLKASGDIVLRSGFRFTKGDAKALRVVRDDIFRQRSEKHPNLAETPCIGSFFRNVEPSSSAERRMAAGWFLEQAGAKDFRVGKARTYEKHANIIIAEPGCTAQDVYDLSQSMVEAVQKQFGLVLIREARLLGRFRGAKEVPASQFH